MGSADRPDSVVVDRIATRVWRDEDFRRLLFSDPGQALVQEFGRVPDGFAGVRFAPRPVDRAFVRRSRGDTWVVVQPRRDEQPLNVLTRTVFGVPELVVVLYTKRCAYQCSFCTLPSTSALAEVPFDHLRRQFDSVWEFAADYRAGIRQISLGNEGSMLDESTLPRAHLEYLLDRCGAFPAATDIVLETRSEFITPDVLDWTLERIAPARLTLKIGLESADDRIRQQVLRKRMDLASFESVVTMMGQRGVGLASYVLVKADPEHSDEDGRRDAIATCEYLEALCARTGTPLTLRVNAMYRAAHSLWARDAAKCGWVPPSVFDLAEVMWAVVDDRVRVYAGLSEEGLATTDGHFEVRPDFEEWALVALTEYNRTGDIELLRQVAAHRDAGPAH